MKLVERLVEIANFTGNEADTLSPIHIVSILVVVALCAILCIYLRDAKPKTFRITVGVMFGIMLVLEIFKQVFRPMSIVDGAIVYEYDWVMFPFQLCSTPLYILPLLSILPDCKVRDFAAAYTGTYALIGGLAVYLKPTTVLTTFIFTNVQTMIHHGLQIVSGVYALAYYRRRINARFFFGGVAVFGVVFAIANLFNTVFHSMMLSIGAMPEDAIFNMFYISPRPDQATPMLSDILKSFNPLILIVGYFLALTICAWIVLYGFKAVYSLVVKGKKDGIT